MTGFIVGVLFGALCALCALYRWRKLIAGRILRRELREWAEDTLASAMWGTICAATGMLEHRGIQWSPIEEPADPEQQIQDHMKSCEHCKLLQTLDPDEPKQVANWIGAHLVQALPDVAPASHWIGSMLAAIGIATAQGAKPEQILHFAEGIANAAAQAEIMVVQVRGGGGLPS